jgi:hypothetical protein
MGVNLLISFLYSSKWLLLGCVLSRTLCYCNQQNTWHIGDVRILRN